MHTDTTNFPARVELGGKKKLKLDCVMFQAERSTGVPDVTHRNAGFHIYLVTRPHLDHIPNRHDVGVSIWEWLLCVPFDFTVTISLFCPYSVSLRIKHHNFCTWCHSQECWLSHLPCSLGHIWITYPIGMMLGLIYESGYYVYHLISQSPFRYFACILFLSE